MNDDQKCSCPFQDWEAIPWVFVLLAAAIVLSLFLGGNGG